MPRFARVIHPGHPHHVVHRGNRRQEVYFDDDDKVFYTKLLRLYAARFGVRIWAYCLMPNHVHLVAVPAAPESLAKAVGATQWRYAQWVNRRLRRTGHLWENRYYSSPLDEQHLWAAVRYVERNPLRAGLVDAAEEFRWSSARAHALRAENPLLDDDRPFAGRSFDWSAWLNEAADGLEADRIRANTDGSTHRGRGVRSLDRGTARPHGPSPTPRSEAEGVRRPGISSRTGARARAVRLRRGVLTPGPISASFAACP